MIAAIDSLWIIVFNLYGYFGLISLFGVMLLPPFCFLREVKYRRDMNSDITPFVIPVVLSLVVIFFMIDNLVNAMINPIYILSTGAIVSHLKWNKIIRSV